MVSTESTRLLSENRIIGGRVANLRGVDRGQLKTRAVDRWRRDEDMCGWWLLCGLHVQRFDDAKPHAFRRV
jgi:hypothetical protein